MRPGTDQNALEGPWRTASSKVNGNTLNMQKDSSASITLHGNETPVYKISP